VGEEFGFLYRFKKQKGLSIWDTCRGDYRSALGSRGILGTGVEEGVGRDHGKLQIYYAFKLSLKERGDKLPWGGASKRLVGIVQGAQIPSKSGNHFIKPEKGGWPTKGTGRLERMTGELSPGKRKRLGEMVHIKSAMQNSLCRKSSPRKGEQGPEWEGGQKTPFISQVSTHMWTGQKRIWMTGGGGRPGNGPTTKQPSQLVSNPKLMSYKIIKGGGSEKPKKGQRRSNTQYKMPTPKTFLPMGKLRLNNCRGGS